MRLRLGLTCALAVLLVTPLDAQQVTGRITNQQTGEPLAAVQVFIAGSGIGALSQQNGRYLLLNVPVGTHTLTAERIGYRSVTQQITVAAGETVVQDFALAEQALGLDEIIVTGTPGGTQRRAIGNVVSSVSAAAVTQITPVSSMQDLLSSRSTGLRFVALSPSVGTGSSFQIRGTQTFNLSSDPLIYIDGVRVNNDSRAGPAQHDPRQEGRRMAKVNVFEDLNPEEIESIEIIKGPAAATLYGTEASAGVIQILTKRGQQGAPQFSLSTRQGVNFLMDPAGRMGLLWGCTTKLNPPCTEEVGGLFSYNMYDETNTLIREGRFEWPKENLYNYGRAQAYNLDVRGGTDQVRYYVAASREDDTGYEWTNTNKSTSFRANLNLLLTQNLTLDVSSGYVDGSTRLGDTPDRGGSWLQMIWGNGYCLPRISQTCLRRLGFERMTPAEIATVETTRDFRRFTGGSTLSFNYGEWLNSRITFGLDQSWDENGVFYPLDKSGNAPMQTFQTGQVQVSRPTTRYLSVDWAATARYRPSARLGTATSVGVQFNTRRFNQFSVVGVGLPTELSRTVNHTDPAQATIGYQFVDNKALGLYVQEELSWNERVFLTGALRFDDNSAFGTEFDPLIYPKLSATWVLSDEAFWPTDAVNSFRLRGAWGQAGRQPSAFASTNLYGVLPGAGGLGTLNPIGPGNPAVGPEKSSELELGFDAAFLGERIAGEFTYFRKKSEDMLLDIALPMSVGFAGATQQNLGRLDTWGWELSLDNRVFESPAFSFELNLTAEHLDNEIKDLGDFPGGTHRGSELRVGLPFPNRSTAWSVMDAKLDPAGRSVDGWGRRYNAFCDVGVSLAPAGAKNPGQYGIVPGGALVNCSDRASYRIFDGRGFPSYTFRVSPAITLFNNAIRISALAEGQHGLRSRDENATFNHQYNTSRYARVQTLGENLTTAAGVLLRDQLHTTNFDGDFWRVREIGLLYNIAESLANRIGADRASLSVTARNMLILWQAQTDVSGVTITDPERNSSVEQFGGENYWLSPPLSSVSAMLRVSF